MGSSPLGYSYDNMEGEIIDRGFEDIGVKSAAVFIERGNSSGRGSAIDRGEVDRSAQLKFVNESLAAGQPVTGGTSDRVASSELTNRHAYAILDVFRRDGINKYKLYDPKQAKELIVDDSVVHRDFNVLSAAQDIQAQREGRFGTSARALKFRELGMQSSSVVHDSILPHSSSVASAAAITLPRTPGTLVVRPVSPGSQGVLAATSPAPSRPNTSKARNLG